MTNEAELPDVWINTGDLRFSDGLVTEFNVWMARKDRGAGYIRYAPAARLDALRAKLDAVRADAERYRWLREAPPYSARWPRWRIEHWSGAWNPVQGSDMDAAIDAARKENSNGN